MVEIEHPRRDGVERIVEGRRRTGSILIVEDDPEVRELLELSVKDEGHRAAAARDGVAAMELLAEGQWSRPHPRRLQPAERHGRVAVAASLRERLHRHIPVIVLTGDISTGALRDIALQDCARLNKPVKLKELTEVIQRLLVKPQAVATAQHPRVGEAATVSEPPTIFVVDDDSQVCEAIRAVLKEDGRTVKTFATCEAFLEAYRSGQRSLPADRRLSAGDERARIAAKASRCRRSAARHHDHRQ